jgi:hypothetical protein
MANWWDKNLTDKQKFRLQEPKDPSLLDVVSTVPNPVGDVASGLLAAQDVSKGNYGSAALNALGLLPFVPSMGASIKNVGKSAKTEFELAHDLAQQRAALPIAKGGLGLPANNTAMDRAKAMGNDTLAYTGSNIEGEIESMLPKSWFSKEPGYSSTYSTVIPVDGISKNPRVYPVLLRTGKTEVNPMFGLYEDMEKALSKKKTDTFKVEGVGGGTNDFYVTKNPNQVRSIYAAFDPFRRNEADILAGVAPLAVGSLLGLNTYNNMQEKPKKEKKTK